MLMCNSVAVNELGLGVVRQLDTGGCFQDFRHGFGIVVLDLGFDEGTKARYVAVVVVIVIVLGGQVGKNRTTDIVFKSNRRDDRIRDRSVREWICGHWRKRKRKRVDSVAHAHAHGDGDDEKMDRRSGV